jgi:DNA-binding NtrC family response regulator
LKTPSLRDRRDDIPLLIQHFLSVAEHHNANSKTFSPKAMEVMRSLDWPGNVRELKNMVDRLIILSEGSEIGLTELSSSFSPLQREKLSSLLKGPQEIEGTNWDSLKKRRLDEVERLQILDTIREFKGNKSQAAKRLGITLKTLYNKLHKYGVLEDDRTDL